MTLRPTWSTVDVFAEREGVTTRGPGGWTALGITDPEHAWAWLNGYHAGKTDVDNGYIAKTQDTMRWFTVGFKAARNPIPS